MTGKEGRTSLPGNKMAGSPMVEMNVALKASSENLKRTHVLPTPESPMRSNLNK